MSEEAEKQIQALRKRRRRSLIKAVAFIVLLLVLAAVGRALNVGDLLTEGAAAEALSDILNGNPLQAYSLFVLIMVVGCTALALPIVAFALLSGALFGPVLGLVLCMVAGEISAVISFVLGRFFLRDFIKPLALKNKYLKRWLFDETNHSIVLTMALTRLVPIIPYNLQNFAYGVTDVRLVAYTVFTFVFTLPGNAVCCLVASAIAFPELRFACIVATVVIVVVVLVILAILYLRFFNKTADQK